MQAGMGGPALQPRAQGRRKPLTLNTKGMQQPMMPAIKMVNTPATRTAKEVSESSCLACSTAAFTADSTAAVSCWLSDCSGVGVALTLLPVPLGAGSPRLLDRPSAARLLDPRTSWGATVAHATVVDAAAQLSASTCSASASAPLPKTVAVYLHMNQGCVC